MLRVVFMCHEIVPVKFLLYFFGRTNEDRKYDVVLKMVCSLDFDKKRFAPPVGRANVMSLIEIQACVNRDCE